MEGEFDCGVCVFDVIPVCLFADAVSEELIDFAWFGIGFGRGGVWSVEFFKPRSDHDGGKVSIGAKEVAESGGKFQHQGGGPDTFFQVVNG